MTVRKRAPIFPMTAQKDRIIAAISLLIVEAGSRGYEVTQYDLVKSLFLADRAHLNKYGRPITFDNYVAMKDGPVPSLSYDFLKDDRNAIRRHNINLPWRRTEASHIAHNAFVYSIDKNAVNTDALSPSDARELKAALVIIKSLGFNQVRKLTHDDAAYIDAWEEEGTLRRYSMSYMMLFDVPSEELAADLSFLSKHM
jgi:uncharacterized phage-associated protein